MQKDEPDIEKDELDIQKEETDIGYLEAINPKNSTISCFTTKKHLKIPLKIKKGAQ